MIHIKNICYSYNNVNGKQKFVFENIKLRIRKGEFVSILGKSGCGKTTLANLLAGYIEPSSGSILINNTPVKKPGRNRIVVNQQHDLFDWMTVKENISLVEKNNQKILNLLRLAELEEFANVFPVALSGGLKKKLSIVRALAADPEIIIFDEPFSSLDPVTKLELQTELDYLCKRAKKTTLLVTHDIDEAILLSDRIVILKGSPAKIQKEFYIDVSHPRSPELFHKKYVSDIKKKITDCY